MLYSVCMKTLALAMMLLTGNDIVHGHGHVHVPHGLHKTDAKKETTK